MSENTDCILSVFGFGDNNSAFVNTYHLRPPLAEQENFTINILLSQF